MASEPLVSCLCVTERRSAFMPWLLWNFDRQTFRSKELVIVDSSPEPFRSERADVRVLTAPPGTNVPTKRNLALDAATGSVVAWFDDDDWQHPERLALLVKALENGHDQAGSTRSWFVDLHSRRCHEYFGYRALIFNSAGFRTELARAARFNEGVRKASDTIWLRDVAAKNPRHASVPDQLMLWLCHDDNISNSRTRRRFPSSLEELKASLGPQTWGDTDARLAELCARLPPPATLGSQAHGEPDESGDAPPDRATPARRLLGRARPAQPAPVAREAEERTEAFALETGSRTVCEGGAAGVYAAPTPDEGYETRAVDPKMPEVSLVILTRPGDLAHLELLAAHVERQAKHPFGERLVILPNDMPVLAAEPGTRPPPTAVRSVDRTLQVPAREAAAELLCAYLEPATAGCSALVSDRALAELWSLHQARSHHVLLCHAGVFFHASGSSWVHEALLRMRSDPGLWLMTTHPGPPAGPVGHPKSRPRGRLSSAQWDRRLRIWRTREACPSYYLVDRRKLLGALPRLESAPESLAAWVSHLPCEGRGGHGSVATKGSWAVDAGGETMPGADWVPALMELVTRGACPTIQRGWFELPLSDPAFARAWARMVGEVLPRASAA
jgi:hypothetical protein